MLLEFIVDMINLCHQFLIMFTRGLNISLFNHFLLGKQLLESVFKIQKDISKFFIFRDFMGRLERDFPLLRFVVKENIGEGQEVKFNLNNDKS